ncbi:putative TetR family transcriptional regulator [Nocardia brasiliensis NBRC 14402]|uniref:TetR/AcrR family transcriptional regulator n=1 Tax=Nocardia brasiliensis TaxID=37326 RepID=UPI0002D6EF77|nr:TetR/AcrR family transcriptional regulator [Nocardia brasiliensis]ASF09447.1 TetR/AcrR family transcriptional regulator [Nocardia brasiliensis]GAJ86618.1 putative TetR family transcriptional regulator [Nocardia brasiliensis NBRC 14402]SUB39845.1 DNA-binding transcriptional repressor AcrR [Nocardia brasiliensis]
MNADRRTQAERSAATRAAVIRAARDLFGRFGYGAVSTVAVAEAAGVSRGALYHQFSEKRELFEAVFEDLERSLVEVIGTAVAEARSDDPIAGLIVGCLAWLDASTAPEVRRIALLDGPAVLGWHLWREIELRHTIGRVENALAGAIAAGRIRRQPVRPLALIIVGALDEAAQILAHSAESTDDTAAVRAVIEQLITGLTIDA